MVEIKINISNIEQIKSAFNQAPALMTKSLSKAIKQTVFFLRGEGVKAAPVKTGHLRGSAYTEFAPLRGEVGFNATYAEVVHEGSSPYTIFPKSKKALYWQGASHPVRRVNHPGIRANPYLRRAVDDNMPQVDAFFTKAVQDVLDEIAKGTN